MILNPDTVIGECLETSFGLKTYLELIETAKCNGNFVTDEFRKKFNAYYKVRQRKPEWYDCYYSLMSEQKIRNRSFRDILNELSIYGTLEVSFTSKMISTIDPNRPIWDQYVLKSLNKYKEWNSYNGKDLSLRIDKANEIYCEIEQWYANFLQTQECADCLSQFDSILPYYADKITDIKKIDYMLYSKR